MTTTRAPKPPPPVQFPEDAPYWDGARAGKLMGKRCLSCGQRHHYPRPRCPFCGSAQTEWVELAGRGHVYSHTVLPRAPRPTAPAIVELVEGPRITTAVVDADVHALRIGDEVEVFFEPTPDGPPVPRFTTPAARAGRAHAEAALAACDTAVDPAAQARVAEMRQAAVVGAGTMGVGITLTLLAAGFAVTLVDKAEPALVQASSRIGQALADGAERGRWSAEQAAERTARLATATDIARIATADLVIEAVWEQMALKQAVFADIDAHARADALLGSNTSTLDIDRIAQSLREPQRLVGLHFFSPAHVMKLLEIVRGPRSDPARVAEARALARRLGKVGVVVGVCDGFVGNRMMIAREGQAARLLLEGAQPQDVDRVLTEFGLPMGTFELQDMAGGIEISARRRQESGQHDPLIHALFSRGRVGQKAGRGWYRYESGKRTPLPDPEVAALIEGVARDQGITRRRIADEEIRDRLLLPMINVAARLIEEGIVERVSDIDAVWLAGYGWPRWRGGPLHWADSLGAPWLLERLDSLQERHGERFRPSALIERMARTGERFADLRTAG